MLIKVIKGQYKGLVGYIEFNGDADLYDGNRKILTTLSKDEYKIIQNGEKNGL